MAIDALFEAQEHATRDGDGVLRKLVEAALLYSGQRLAREMASGDAVAHDPRDHQPARHPQLV